MVIENLKRMYKKLKTNIKLRFIGHHGPAGVVAVQHVALDDGKDHANV